MSIVYERISFHLGCWHNLCSSLFHSNHVCTCLYSIVAQFQFSYVFLIIFPIFYHFLHQTHIKPERAPLMTCRVRTSQSTTKRSARHRSTALLLPKGKVRERWKKWWKVEQKMEGKAWESTLSSVFVDVSFLSLLDAPLYLFAITVFTYVYSILPLSI